MSCDNKNPLQRNGTSQQQRMPEALKNGYVLAEERDYKEWIVFAGQFAQWINYFDQSNTLKGNWQPFFQSDISAILGSIAIQDINIYRRIIKEKFEVLRADKNKLKEDLLKETFNGLFGGILSLCLAIDNAASKLPDGNTLKEAIQNLVRTQLQNELDHLLAAYKGASIASLVKDASYPDWIILNRQVENPSTIIAQGSLSPSWLKGETSLNNYYNKPGFTANTELYGTDPELYQKIHHAVNHNLFTSIFDQFLKAYTRIINDAEQLLLQTLTNWNSHTPHYALFIAFLKLFRFSKAGINTLTQRHLDFYYKEVLALAPRAEVPDHAHLIIELAKQADEYMLTKGSLFKAGKDSLGKELVYSLDNDTVFNKASIAGLMSVYKGDEYDAYKVDNEDKNSPVINNKGRLFASPVANSQDGLGADLKTPNKEWHPFFIKTYKDGKLASIDTPKAKLGFAIASHYLYLTEGERTVNLNIVFEDTLNHLPNTTAIECYVTTEKGWYQVAAPAIKQGKTAAQQKCSTVYFTLKGNDPAIANYSAAVHGGVFNCNLPIVKICLRHENNIAYPYDQLSHLNIDSIEVSVTVGDVSSYSQKGLKQLLVANDAGLVDASKPFLPFGAMPKSGSSLVIGNKELFCKKNAAVVLNIEWKSLPANGTHLTYPAGTPPKAEVRHLANGIWSKDGETAVFNGSTAQVAVTNASHHAIPLADETIVDYAGAYLPYGTKSNKGFLKLSLKSDLGNDAYQDAKIRYLVKLAKNPGDASNTNPIAPYTPMISSLYASYTASTSSHIAQNNKASFDSRTVFYFHLYPFGECEQHAYLNNSKDIDLLPQFTHTEGAKNDIADAGSFFIGLKNLKPQQGVNILFQVMEGTSDPSLSVTGTLIHWSYLSNNQWKPFDEQSVIDHTRCIRQSGIISFQVPEDATLTHTLMPSGAIWLKASVTPPNKPGAVCKLLSIAAQAAAVTFIDNNNAPGFLASALPANTISKLKDPVAAIKKISQPYPSFGGKPVETGAHFYMRVNERLRHKDRAITIWDYERLVLETFPGIHRVKCLNHTKYINKDYNEVAPGHVTMITIPDLTHHNEINPLRPYTNADTLLQIKELLQKRISCHVQLHVCNPVFEEIKLEFSLKLLAGYEFSYYSNLLKESITALLSPWAYGKSDDIRFGGRIEKSVLVSFIESQYYVDYITDVKMYHLTETSAATLTDEDEITASMAISILVSVPADKHLIHQVPDVTPLSKKVECVDPYNKQPYEKK